jgi:hypothetical protein
MSAPQTNVEKQNKRHRPAIWGIASVLVFAFVLLIAYLAFLAAQGNEPGEEGTTTDIPAAATD